MSFSYPYVNAPSALISIINKIRKSSLSEVTVKTLQQLNLAPKNESYIINTLKFIGVIDEECKRISHKPDFFLEQDDAKFSKGFEKLIIDAYKELFKLHNENPWDISDKDLITFFRADDSASELIGKKRANTFRILSAIAGHGEPPKLTGQYKKNTTTISADKRKLKSTAKLSTSGKTKNSSNLDDPQNESGAEDIPLTVRIEINLPSDGDQETYDMIFKSIKEHLSGGRKKG